MTIFFTMSVMIWERPYFEYTATAVVGGQIVPRIYFSTVQSSLWYTLITMTTVGYGDVTAVTPVGRFLTIVMIFTGLYLTALLIAVQSNLLSLKEEGKSAIV